MAWRQRWADRCNELEAEGVPWPDHERQAFREIAEGLPEPDRRQALRQLAHPALQVPEPGPIELVDGVLVYEPGDRDFGT